MKCAACEKPVQTGLIHFCHSCYWSAPAQERVALHRMHLRKEDVTAKVQKIARILKSKSHA